LVHRPLGLRNALLFGTVVYLVATLLPFLGRHWREMDQPAPVRKDLAEVLATR